MGKFYNGGKLLTLKDIDGEKPAFIMCVGNRTAGKTFYFKRLLLRRYINKGQKFAIICRYKNELDAVKYDYFKDVIETSFPKESLEFTFKNVSKNLYINIYLNGEKCGVAIAISSSDGIKRFSQNFSDIENMFFDEFQSESGTYIPDEFILLKSLITSISRGGGKSYRYVPLYMCSNAVTMNNPYYKEFGIAGKLHKLSGFNRGPGWVLETCFIEDAANSLKNAAHMKGDKYNKYTSFAVSNSYLLDNTAFIEKHKCVGSLLLSITDAGTTVGVWELDKGILYCSSKYDLKGAPRYVYRNDDHDVNQVMIHKSSAPAKYMSDMYERGYMRFETLAIKDAVLDFISCH